MGKCNIGATKEQMIHLVVSFKLSVYLESIILNKKKEVGT